MPTLLRRHFYLIFLMKLKLDVGKKVAEFLSLFDGKGDTLAHSVLTFGPGTDVVYGAAVIPADKIDLFGPAVAGFGKHSDLFYDLILNFSYSLSHFFIPPKDGVPHFL